MNLKSQDPTDVVLGLLHRSSCSVQVSAILVDNYGIYQWGWNHMGFDGMGMCAEAYCLTRANPRRLSESTMYIAARRKRNDRIVTSKPCVKCAGLVRRVGRVVYRDSAGNWVNYN